MKRPESLNDFSIRLRECIASSGEPPKVWASEVGVELKRIENLLYGVTTRPQADLLLAIDDLTGQHLLTPPERTYTELRYAVTKQTYERKYNVLYWKERR